MAESRNRKWQVTLFRSFNSLKKPRNSETSTSTSVEASVDGDSGATVFTHSCGHDSSDSSDCENNDLVSK